MDRRLAYIALNLVPSLSPVETAALLGRFEGRPERIFETPQRQLRQSGILNRKKAAAIRERGLAERASAELRRAESMGAHVLTPVDALYPQDRLGQIHDPPLALYVAGDPKVLSFDGIAVVGSRRATPYGKTTSRTLARELAFKGAAIFSGLARGIDAAAHKGALEAGGVTAAVLGSGIDVIYPRDNARLAERIVSCGGAVVSEMPLGTQPLPFQFPRRNRIISGLSWGVLVIEADQKSGSLITARLGMEQGRDVFAVPGNITSTTSVGANLLIRSGAKLVQGGQDVIEELLPQVVERMAERAARRSRGREAAQDGPSSADTMTAAGLPEAATRIFRELRTDEALGIEDLARTAGMAAHELHPHLIAMELSGLVRMIPGGRYLRCV